MCLLTYPLTNHNLNVPQWRYAEREEGDERVEDQHQVPHVLQRLNTCTSQTAIFSPLVKEAGHEWEYVRGLMSGQAP